MTINISQDSVAKLLRGRGHFIANLLLSNVSKPVKIDQHLM